MKSNKTHIVLVLDNSGSMELTKLETMQGFNTLIEKHAKAEGRCKASIIMFNTEPKQVYNSVDIKDVELLTSDTYKCSGMTSLHDAMGMGITNLAEKLAGKKNQPTVIFVTLTDGGENSSSKFSGTMVKKLVDEYTAKGWQFVFVGANQDAALTGASLGIGASNSLTFAANSKGVSGAYDSLADLSLSVRSGACGSMAFRASDRDAQVKAGVK